MLTQLKSGDKQEPKALDLDSLALDPLRIELQNGVCLQVKDMDLQTYLGFTTQIRAMNTAQAMDRPLAMAEAVLSFLEDEETSRQLLDDLPITRIAEIWNWLRRLDEPLFRIGLDPTLGRVTIAGKEYFVTYPTVKAYREMLHALSISTVGIEKGTGADVHFETATPEQIYDAQLRYMAYMIPGVTVKELRDTDPRKVKALDDYLTDIVTKAFAEWTASQQSAPTRPTLRRGAA